VSENLLKIIPSSPTYIPGKGRVEEALARIKEAFAFTDNIRVVISESPRFIDQGTNFERIICPNCNAILNTCWWQSAMDKAHRNGFNNLRIKVPCCGTETNLNELKYEWPAGFARFSIEISNPEIDLSDSTFHELEFVLGSSLKKIWAHY